MLHYYNYDIVCQEIPDEITLAVNISGCPNHCNGCHSPWLWNDVGEPLTEEALCRTIDRYEGALTCVCLMGGDGAPSEVDALVAVVRRRYSQLRTAWYSGRAELATEVEPSHLDYLKLGPYVASLGGLRSTTTNQRLWRLFADGSRRRVDFGRHGEPTLGGDNSL